MRITKENKNVFQGRLLNLLGDGRKHSQKEIASNLDITNNQARTIVTNIRKDVKKGKYPITTFIVANRNGYYMPVTNDDYLEFYKNVYAWATTALARLKPISDYLTSEGINMTEVRKELKEKKMDDDFDPFQMDEKDHWR